MDRLDTMRAFVAVASEGSFAGAARRLRWSPSAVTRSIAELEGRLGRPLFNRTTRSVRLTPDGAAHLAACRDLLDAFDAAEARFRGRDPEPRGLLTVAAPLVFGRLHVLPVVVRLLSAHPELAVRLILSDGLARLVDEGVDVAIRIGALDDAAFKATRLAEVRRVTVASPAYLAARGTPSSPADLAGHDVIAFENAGQGDDWRFAGLRPGALRRRLMVNGAEAALAAAEAGLGITRALSYQVADALRGKRLRMLPGAFSSVMLPVSAVHVARKAGSPNVSAFVRTLRAAFQAEPPFAAANAPPSAKTPPCG